VSEFATIRRDLLLNGVLAWPALSNRPRVAGLRALGMRIGTGVYVAPGLLVRWHGRGDRQRHLPAVRVLRRQCGAGADRAALLDRMETMLLTGTHEIGDAQRRRGLDRHAPVTIGDGCWFGARVTVTPGVTVGQGCVVGSGAVVVKDCEPDGLYVGSPARRVRDLG
jgi:maltose O-acetyltransferase